MITSDDYNKADKVVLATIAGAGGMTDSDQAYVWGEVESFGVDETWFRETRHVKMFTAMRKVWREKHCVDCFLTAQAYDGERAEATDFFVELCDMVTTTGQLVHYLHAFRELRIYSAAHRLTVEMLKEMKPDNIGVVLEDFVKKIHDLQERCAAGDGALKTLGDFMAQSLEKKRRLHEERFVRHNWEYLDGLPFPWKELDQIFAGLKTGIHVIAALASNGKSAMAVDLSVFWNERGIKHGFFSIDMAAEQLADRYPCVMNRVSLAKLNFGGSSDDVQRFADGFDRAIRYGNVWLSEIDDAKTIEYQCYRGVKTLGWKAIIIDYIQLVCPDEKGNLPEYTRVQHAVQAVKAVAKKLKVPIIALAQLSRAFEQQLREKGFPPGLDAIGDSAEIARAAASVTCLYKDLDIEKYWKETPPAKLGFADPNDLSVRYGVADYRTETPEETKARRDGQKSLAAAVRPMWFDVRKNQQGRTGRVPFAFFPNYFLFRPGNSDGEKSNVTVEGKSKTLPVQMFEQIRDDWTYTEQDWFYEMLGVIPQRGVKLMGETYAEMRERMKRERAAHADVRQFEYDEDGNGRFLEFPKTS